MTTAISTEQWRAMLANRTRQSDWSRGPGRQPAPTRHPGRTSSWHGWRAATRDRGVRRPFGVTGSDIMLADGQNVPH